MIAFDNGPPDGDYARYIDQLMHRELRRRAARDVAAPAAGFTASPVTTPAAAFAAARINGPPAGTRAWTARTMAALAALAVGLVLLVAGFFSQPPNVLPMAGGGALVAWAIRSIVDAARRMRSRTA